MKKLILIFCPFIFLLIGSCGNNPTESINNAIITYMFQGEPPMVIQYLDKTGDKIIYERIEDGNNEIKRTFPFNMPPNKKLWMMITLLQSDPADLKISVAISDYWDTDYHASKQVFGGSLEWLLQLPLRSPK